MPIGRAGWGIAAAIPSSSAAIRNLRKAPAGLAEEINFEDFLTIMSYFRPIEMDMDEERLESFRKEKLKCEAVPRGSGAQGGPHADPASLSHPSQSSSICTMLTTTGSSRCRSTKT